MGAGSQIQLEQILFDGHGNPSKPLRSIGYPQLVVIKMPRNADPRLASDQMRAYAVKRAPEGADAYSFGKISKFSAGGKVILFLPLQYHIKI